MHPVSQDFEVCIVGGGVTALAVAHGLLRRSNRRVAVLDEGDIAFRSSSSNFGLVWFQGKGVGKQDYVRLVRTSVRLWADLARELNEASGIDIGFEQRGGLRLCLGESAAETRKNRIAALDEQGGTERYECEFLDRSQLEALFVQIRLSDEVQTASFSPLDGHVNPLYLMNALLATFVRSGGDYLPEHHVTSVTPIASGGFTLRTARGAVINCQRLLLAAGLGNSVLADALGLRLPIVPERGQILVTQRTDRVFPLPMNGFRQTAEGTILLGSSVENVGMNDGTSPSVISRIAKLAVRTFPQLGQLQLQRAWGGLRIQSPDRYPIYAASAEWPGLFAVTCHSGITHAAVHASILPSWILGESVSPLIPPFGPERFDVQAN